MAYVPKIFVDRSVEFPFRRLLTPVSGQANTVDVSRVPGTVFAEGDEPDATNLNAEFGKIKTETDAINTSLNGLDFVEISTGKWGYKIGGADPVIPFSSLDFLTNITCTGVKGVTATASFSVPSGVTKVLVCLSGTTFEWSTGDFRATDICTVTSSGGTLVETTIAATQNLNNNGTSAYVKSHKIEKIFNVKAGDTIVITSYANGTQWAISYANASIYAL